MVVLDSDCRMTDIDLISTFMYSGRAVFTIQSETTGNYHTYKVFCKKEGEPYFVSLLINGDYKYLGYIKRGEYNTSAKSCRDIDHSAHKMFRFLMGSLRYGKLHSKMSFYHEGRCGRCGRPLTNPESIRRGLGATCAGY